MRTRWALLAPSQAIPKTQALARLHDITLVIRASCENAMRRHQGSVHSLEMFRLARQERTCAWIVHRIFRDNTTTKCYMPSFIHASFSRTSN